MITFNRNCTTHKPEDRQTFSVVLTKFPQTCLVFHTENKEIQYNYLNIFLLWIVYERLLFNPTVNYYFSSNNVHQLADSWHTSLRLKTHNQNNSSVTKQIEYTGPHSFGGIDSVDLADMRNGT